MRSMQSYDMKLCSRLYSSWKTTPFQIIIPTRCQSPPRQVGAHFPMLECVMDCATTQSYIHDCFVKVIGGSQTHCFQVFFKRHCHLLPSRSLAPFQGDIIVMRAGFLHSLSVVNMRGRDTIILDFMISK